MHDYLREDPKQKKNILHIRNQSLSVSEKSLFTTVIHFQVTRTSRLEPIVDVECVPENNSERLFGRRWATFVSLAKVATADCGFKPLR
jgi:hypothetical protein